MRKACSLAPLARLKTRLDDELRKQLPKSYLRRAIAYALSQWASLQIYLELGRCEVEDNPVQNAIYSSAVAKKNYLFMVSSDSGHWSATFYSLVGSCLHRRLNTREYCWATRFFVVVASRGTIGLRAGDFTFQAGDGARRERQGAIRHNSLRSAFGTYSVRPLTPPWPRSGEAM